MCLCFSARGLKDLLSISTPEFEELEVLEKIHWFVTGLHVSVTDFLYKMYEKLIKKTKRKRKMDNTNKCDAEWQWLHFWISKQKVQNISHFDLNTASAIHYSLLVLWKIGENDDDSCSRVGKLYHRPLSVLILLKTKSFLSYFGYWIFAIATVWSCIIYSRGVLSEMILNINSIGTVLIYTYIVRNIFAWVFSHERLHLTVIRVFMNIRRLLI